MTRQRSRGHTVALFAGLAGLTGLATAQLPYNPTTIVLSSDDSFAYILQPDSDSSASLSSLALSGTLNSSSLSIETLYKQLPFVNSTSPAYTTFSESSGNITLLVGNCSEGAQGAQIWRFRVDSQLKHGNGTWTQDELSPQGAEVQTLTGANYLSAGVVFSEIVAGNLSDTGLYVFGGMCPAASASTSNWTSSANYTDTMVLYYPETITGSTADYQTSIVASKGPPIPEAGLTMTGLSASYSNTSGVETQQRNFVLIGGHTETAFLNMSQVALFSLPEESWSFVDVDQPSTASKTDLSRKDTATTIEPRSGHTAVLSEDGNSIIVFGGWVGDVDTPATPQLIVLGLGSGYGGTGDWYWDVPTQSGTATLTTAGIYGHGAAMLPGGVMMIAGGYTISNTTSGLARRATQTRNTQTLFYNVTSSDWLSSYSASAQSSETPSFITTNDHKKLATPGQKAGLGVGLAVAILLVIGLLVYYFWYTKRVRRNRANRRSDQSTLFGGEKKSFDNTWLGKNSIDGNDGIGGESAAADQMSHDPGKEAFPWLPQIAAVGWKADRAKTREADGSGLFVNIPSPTRGLRKAMPAHKYSYHAAPGQDAGGIHPIEETDEEDRLSNGGMTGRDGRHNAINADFGPEARLKAVELALSSHPAIDPFRDPDPIHSVSPIPEEDVDHFPAANSGRYTPSVYDVRSGRSSPVKSMDERTSSTLSEQSQDSYLSSRSIARTTSTRTNAIFGLAGTPYMTPQTSPTEERSCSVSSKNGRSRTSTAPNRVSEGEEEEDEEDDRFSTARTSNFTQLQLQGEALLGASARPSLPKARPASTQTFNSLLGHNTETPVYPRHQRRPGWMGSIRRLALGSSVRSLSLSTSPASARGAGGLPMDPAAHYYDCSSSSSPTKSMRGTRPSGASPRRTASDGSALLSLKRGKSDWAPSSAEKGAWAAYGDEPDGGDWGDDAAAAVTAGGLASGGGIGGRRLPASLRVGGGIRQVRRSEQENDADTDWDVEKAAEMRDVQVMFTVPKARLRVVNADVDKLSLRSVSDGGRSVAGLDAGAGALEGEGLEGEAAVGAAVGGEKVKDV